MNKIIDKEAVRQIFGCLMKTPQKLSETDKYRLTIFDFYSLFERSIFSAIYNLYNGGATKITEIDIDNYFDSHKEQKAIFEKENGIEYLQDALDFCQEDNFPFYYRRLKKFNCINSLKQIGYDTSKIYCEDLLNPNIKKINERFEELEVNDIFLLLKKEIMGIETEFKKDNESETVTATTGIRKLVDSLKVTPEVGSPLQGKIFNTVCRGARSTKFYIRSANSGTGKTRSAVGDACFLAYPIRFNPTTWEWEKNGSCEKTLFIATEQEYDEIQTLILAYLTGFNEEKILYSDYNESEKIIIQQALDVMDYYKDNLYLARLSNPNIESIQAKVRENWILYGIKNVFYDYIFSSPSLLNEFRDLKIREDVALSMLSTALKDLAVEMDLFMMSSTQTNAKAKEEQGLKDESVIRGARSIIDKCDIACVISTVSESDEELLKDIIEKIGITPNQVCDVYKVRRGRYSKVRIWSEVDLGTCRKKDLFITNERNLEIENFKIIVPEFSEVDDSYWKQLLDNLNNNMNNQLDEILKDEQTETKTQVIKNNFESKKESKKNLFDGYML